MITDEQTLGEKIGDLLIRPWIRGLTTLCTMALFAMTGIVFAYTSRDYFKTSAYIVFVVLPISYLRYLEYEAEQRRLKIAEQTALYRRLTYEHAAEVLSPSQSSLFGKLNDSLLPVSSNEEEEFIETYIEDLLEDLTTRVFEADVRVSEFGRGKWAAQSFKATLMVKRPFTQQEFEEVSNLIQNDKEMKESEKESKKQRYKEQIGKYCMFIEHWYYPGNAHPESLGIPYMINDGVAGRAWFMKSLTIWTPTQSCTPRIVLDSNIFAEKYRGQQSKYTSMACVPVESLCKEKKFLAPSDTADDGILGILTITCERKGYFRPEIDFAKYLQTLLAPYMVILSYALERVCRTKP